MKLYGRDFQDKKNQDEICEPRQILARRTDLGQTMSKIIDKTEQSPAQTIGHNEETRVKTDLNII